MWQQITIPFITTLLSEFFDKSQLSILLLSTKTKHHTTLLLGTILGFIVVDGLAIIFGSFLSTLIPASIIKIGAGLLFIIFGILTLKQNHAEKASPPSAKNAFFAGFAAIAASEWGDKTQLAAGIFSTQYNPILVFIGVITALSIVSFAAIYLGKLLSKKVGEKLLHTIAGVLFIGLGILFLLF